LQLKLTEKQDKQTPKQERNNIRAEINKIEKKKNIERINGTKFLFFEKGIKNDRPLGNLNKMKKENPQNSKIINAKV
jgi:hypothetical protein